jgi:hypothetical protein
MSEYRIVRDNYAGFEVQRRTWWWPFWRWEAPKLVHPKRLDPMMNAFGLQWQPARIEAQPLTTN